MMGSFSDAEGAIFWRFHRQDLNIGSRFESTVLISFSYPLYQQQGNIPTRPYPKPDWRIFLETFIEHTTPSRTTTGHLTPATTRWLAGPSVLGLYGKWGIAFGLLLPIHQQPVEENSRFLLNLSYWL